jgi:uncharacterized protein GlcG (DUF336 family)
VPTTQQLTLLQAAPVQGGDAGGFNHRKLVWGAVVDRYGQLCAVAASSEDEWAAWAGSRGIAMEKAFTANAFSTDSTPMSTARLYTLAQPDHSFFGLDTDNRWMPGASTRSEGPRRALDTYAEA